LLQLTGFGLSLAFGCSVFPDQAILPLAEQAGAGAEEAGANAGEPAQSNAGAGTTAGAGNASQGGSISDGGSSHGGKGGGGGAGAITGGGSEPLGGANEGGTSGGGVSGGGVNSGGSNNAGTAGSIGSAGCAPMLHQVKVTGDTWIESNKPNVTHATDTDLYVVGGVEERRTLLLFDLPAVSAGSKLNSAILKLKLLSNADMTKVSRQLELHVVTQAVDDTQATWLNWTKGAKGKWTVAGGDFGPVEAIQTLDAGTTSGQVRFDVSSVVRPLLKTSSVPLDLIVVEGGNAPAVPAELAFASLEGDAAGYPVLSLDTCEP
jgi:hypothetical protein